MRLRVLGGLSLQRPDGSALAPLPKRRAEAVLAVLAVCGELGCARQRLMALIWPESDDARARHGLRDALHAIRRTLGAEAVSGGQLLRLEPAVVECDLELLREATKTGRLGDAAGLYSGPLLDGFHLDDAPDFERWLDAERTRLAREQAERLEQLAHRAAGEGESVQAAAWLARAVEHDPLNSRLVLRLVEASATMGEAAKALKIAGAHTSRLHTELEVDPPAEFTAGVERIRHGRHPAASTPKREPPSAASGEPTSERHVTAAVSGDDTQAQATRVLPTSKPITRQARPVLWVTAAMLLVVVAALGGRWLSSARRHPSPHPRTAIALLPFTSLSADSSSAFFAAGLHDELMMQLSKVASLTVVGTTSMGEYRETSKSAHQIADELGVGSLVEASVQVDGRRLRVIVQLLDPASRAEIWSEHYERTLDDAFEVQSDIAQRIVAAVGVALSPGEGDAINSAPTQSAEAYRFYLQALQYDQRPGEMQPNFAVAQQLYERALALDSGFAEAHARLALVHFKMWGLHYEHTDVRLNQARAQAEIARRLGSDLPDAHLAVGLAQHWSRGNYSGTLKELNLALRGAPSDAELWAWTGRAYRGIGSFDSALVAFDHARRLNPRDESVYMSMGNMLHSLRRYPEAIAAYRNAVNLAPDAMQPHLSLAWSFVLWKGELDTLRAVLQSLPFDGDPGGGGDNVLSERVELLMMERRPDSALTIIRRATAASDPRVFSLRSAIAHRVSGDSLAARHAYDSTATYYDSVARVRPDDVNAHVGLGQALAALGFKERALREATWLDQHGEADPALALILFEVGKVDSSLAVMDRLLSQPSATSVPYLRLDPHWDPMVRDRRFQALFARYERSHT